MPNSRNLDGFIQGVVDREFSTVGCMDMYYELSASVFIQCLYAMAWLPILAVIYSPYSPSYLVQSLFIWEFEVRGFGIKCAT